MADCVHLSPIYASALFKEETGLGLKRTITDIRLEEACALLTQHQPADRGNRGKGRLPLCELLYQAV